MPFGDRGLFARRLVHPVLARRDPELATVVPLLKYLTSGLHQIPNKNDLFTLP